MTRWAVVLAGGVGSRFWPVSTPERPKQLLPLVTEDPLLSDALARLAPLVPAERTLILTNAGLVNAISELAPQIPRENLIAEPRPRSNQGTLEISAGCILIATAILNALVMHPYVVHAERDIASSRA